MSDRIVERVRALVAPIVTDLSLDLYDLEYRGGTLKVTIDTKPGSSGGVTLDEIALVTRLLGKELENDDPIPGHYTLEVSSPGLERALRTPAHFQREVGKTINLRLRDTVNTERRLQGVLATADEQGVTVVLDEPGTDGTLERTVAYDQIDRARTVFVWGPESKPVTRPSQNGPSQNRSSQEKPAKKSANAKKSEKTPELKEA